MRFGNGLASIALALGASSLYACGDSAPAGVTPPADTVTPQPDAGPAASDAAPDAADATPPKDPRVSLSADALTFTRGCDTASGGQQTLTLSNAGDRDYTIRARVLGGGVTAPFVLDRHQATVPAHGSATVIVAATTISASSAADFAPNRWDDQLEITTDLAGDSPHLVQLHQDLRASVLVVAGASFLHLPDALVDGASEITFDVQNVGSIPASVTLAFNGTAAGAPFSADPAFSTIAPNDVLHAKVRFTPGAVGDSRGLLDVKGDATTCSVAGSSVDVYGHGIERATQIVGGAGQCILGQSGRVYCWQVDELSDQMTSPFMVAGITGAKEIALAFHELCARLADGTVTCNSAYGLSGTPDANGLVPVDGVTHATMLAGGDSNFCVVHGGGQIVCWGDDTWGALGDGSIQKKGRLATVSGITDATAVAVGEGYACAIRGDGTVACWGVGASGRLGNTNDPIASTPVPIAGLSQVTQIAAFDTQACALSSDGGVRCWGGTVKTPTLAGSFLSLDHPRLTMGMATACISGGSGGMWCWGDNVYGMIDPLHPGVDAATPTLVPNGSFVAISHSAEGPCALDASGGVACWIGQPKPTPIVDY